jgi:predicted RNA-binding protein with PIN domain
LYYYIDGYNLLFHCVEPGRSLQQQRGALVRWLQLAFTRAGWAGTLVFDGTHRRDEESGRSYPSPLEVAFAPRGQTADAYIIEAIETARHRRPITVISNDRALRRNAQSYGVKAQPIASFLRLLEAKIRKDPPSKGVSKETPYQMQRLQKIFEERLRSEE